MYIAFALCVILVLPRFFNPDQVRTATRVSEIENYLKYSELVFFIVSFISGLVYLLSFMALYFSSRPEEIFFMPFFKHNYPHGSSRISGSVKIEKRNVPFAKVVIFNESENELGSFFADQNGFFNLRIKPGKYIFQAEGFGFEGKATEAIKIKRSESQEIIVECFKKEDVFVNPKSYHYLIVEKYALFLLSLVAPALSWFIWKYQSITLSLIILSIGLVLFIVFAASHGAKIIIRNRKGQRLTDRELEISDSTGTKKYKAETDVFGNLIALFSPGIYKISSAGCLPRNIRQKERTIGSASIKLG